MAVERVFVKDGKTQSTRVPAAAVRLQAQGWRELPAEEVVSPVRREKFNAGGVLPAGLGIASNVTGSPERVGDPPTRRPRRKDATAEPPPPEGPGDPDPSDPAQPE